MHKNIDFLPIDPSFFLYFSFVYVPSTSTWHLDILYSASYFPLVYVPPTSAWHLGSYLSILRFFFVGNSFVIECYWDLSNSLICEIDVVQDGISSLAL